ncbi:hypothetical protein CC86DRAFT_409812 [Ophiobolus disseminans]|uniref:Uncharacterized protein n=1 Tax=Ophiobolus disseminans TaxID=1469910 RepID=A0A6A6ZPL3_9PLEO|nr:hypothetical protein CC86DRAFT_409812 [Ophiobolus disseminans]
MSGGGKTKLRDSPLNSMTLVTGARAIRDVSTPEGGTIESDPVGVWMGDPPIDEVGPLGNEPEVLNVDGTEGVEAAGVVDAEDSRDVCKLELLGTTVTVDTGGLVVEVGMDVWIVTDMGDELGLLDTGCTVDDEIAGLVDDKRELMMLVAAELGTKLFVDEVLPGETTEEAGPLEDTEIEIVMIPREELALDGDELVVDAEGNENPDDLTGDDDNDVRLVSVSMLRNPDSDLETLDLDVMFRLHETELEVMKVDNEEEVKRLLEDNAEVTGGARVLEKLEELEVDAGVGEDMLLDVGLKLLDDENGGRTPGVVIVVVVVGAIFTEDNIELPRDKLGGTAGLPNEDVEAVTGIDVVDTSVTVVVRPEVMRVVVLVIVEGTVVIAGLLEVVEVMGKGTGIPALCVVLELLDDADIRLLGAMVGGAGGGGLGRDGGLIVVVEVDVVVVVSPPGNVVVNVVTTLDVTGGAGMMGGPGGSPLRIVDEVVVMIVVGPPGTVLVRVTTTLEVVGRAGVFGIEEGGPTRVVAVVLVNVVIWPPEAILVIVTMRLEVPGGGRLVETPGGSDGGRDAMLLLGGRPEPISGGGGGPGGPMFDVVGRSPPVEVCVLVNTALDGNDGVGHGRKGCAGGGVEKVSGDDAGSGKALLDGRSVMTVVAKVVPER